MGETDMNELSHLTHGQYWVSDNGMVYVGDENDKPVESSIKMVTDGKMWAASRPPKDGDHLRMEDCGFGDSAVEAVRTLLQMERRQ